MPDIQKRNSYLITTRKLAVANKSRSVSNKCIGDNTKVAARQSPNCIKKTKK